MAKFKYKFETIKSIKQRFKKIVQRELAVIDLEINKKQNEVVELITLIKENKTRKTEEKMKPANELHFYEKYEGYLIEQIKLTQNYIVEKLKEREKKLKELVQKSKETKTFEKLEEKYFGEFIKNQDKLEQKEMDEFAVKEFIGNK